MSSVEAMQMLLVKLYTREGGLMAQAGALESYGVPVARADGSTWIEFDGLGQPRPGQVRLDPAATATPAEIKTISQALSRNEVRGQPGRYEWRVE